MSDFQSIVQDIARGIYRCAAPVVRELSRVLSCSSSARSRNESGLVLLGAAGCGKSQLVRALAMAISRSPSSVACWRCPSFALFAPGLPRTSLPSERPQSLTCSGSRKEGRTARVATFLAPSCFVFRCPEDRPDLFDDGDICEAQPRTSLRRLRI